MRTIFCGNFEHDARQSELERLFRKFGKVDRVDMKSGFAFVYMEDERDADDAIRGLDRYEFGRTGRRLRVEWTKQERGSTRRIESSRKPAVNSRPSKTLFVINFDPYHTRTRDLERHFDPYGKIVNIRIRKNFAFIHYESQEDATRALDATNYSKLMDRVITVEYAIRDDDDDKGNGRDRSPRRGGYDRGRSPSPYGRQRGSPDYGYGKERGSPDYGHGPRRPMLSTNGRERARIPSPRKERALYSRERSASPRRKMSNGRMLSPPKRVNRDIVSPVKENDHLSPGEYRRSKSPGPESVNHGTVSPVDENEPLSPGEYRRSKSPDSKGDELERFDEEGSPAPGRYRSRSPVERERSRS